MFIWISVGHTPWYDNVQISGPIAVSCLIVLFFWGVYSAQKEDGASKKLRWLLMKRLDTSEQEFVQMRPTQHMAMLLEVRKRIARQFNVPVVKISRDFHLIDYIKWEQCISAASWIVFEKIKVENVDEFDEVSAKFEDAKSIDELADKIAVVLRDDA